MHSIIFLEWFGHSTASTPKLGWGCQEVLGAGGTISLCLPPPGHPSHSGGISPGTKTCRILFYPKQEHPALPGITGIPWSPAPPAQLWEAALKTWLRLRAVTREPSPAQAFPPSLPLSRHRVWQPEPGSWEWLPGTPGHPRAVQGHRDEPAEVSWAGGAVPRLQNWEIRRENNSPQLMPALPGRDFGTNQGACRFYFGWEEVTALSEG